MQGSQIDLYFWKRLPDYFASAGETYKSLPCERYVQQERAYSGIKRLLGD